MRIHYLMVPIKLLIKILMNYKAILVLVIVLTITSNVGSATIELDPTTTYQTITGWGAVTQSGQIECPGFDIYHEELFDLAVDDLGINRLSLPVRSGLENPVDWFDRFMKGEIVYSEWSAHWFEIINDNDDPYVVNPAGFHFSDIDYTIDTVVLPIKERLERSGKQLYLTFHYIDFGNSNFEHWNNPQEYAEFVWAIYTHMQAKYGFVPDAWEIALEPDYPNWTPERVGMAIKYAGDMLKSEGYDPHFIAPSTKSMGAAVKYIKRIVDIPGTVDYISEFSYHRYSGVSIENLQSIADLGKTYNVNTSMLELIAADQETLHEDLTVGNNSAWLQYSLAYCGKTSWIGGGAYYGIDKENPSNPKIMVGIRTPFLRQYFKFIERGAIRIKATTSNVTFDPVGFINPNGDYVVVINAKKSGEINVIGLPPGVYSTVYTTKSGTESGSVVIVRIPGGSLNTQIPDPGVLTVYLVREINAKPHLRRSR